MKRLLLRPWALVLAAALLLGLWTGGVLKPPPQPDRPRVRFWQDSMHPWVKSDHPGTCPICAMALTPIYEETPASTDASVVSLSKDAVTVLNLATEPVRRRDVTQVLRVSGVVEAQESRTAMVSAPATARVDALNVKHAGVAVTQGVWLVKLFSPDLAQRTRFLRAATSNRIAAVPPPDSMNHGTHRPGGRTADMPPETGNVNVPGIRFDLLSSDIPAPISGVVIDQSVTLGQFVTEGQRMITIVDPSVVWFRFDASDRQLAWIRQGQRIEVQTDAVPGQHFHGSVSVIEPSVDDTRRIGRARAVITNSLREGVTGSYALRLGSSADGRISVVIPGVLAVPRSAVLYPGSSAWVYLERGTGHYERRRVRLGREGDDGWEVLSGLDEGDSVVVSGNVLLDSQASFEQGGQSPDDETAAPVPPEAVDSFNAPSPVPISEPTLAPTPRAAPTNSTAQRSTHASTRAGLDHAERLYAAMSGREELKNQMRARIIAEAASVAPPKPEVLTPTQIRVLTELLADIDAQGRALAAGNLEAFNQGLDRLGRHRNPMLVQLAAPPRWGPEMEGIRVLVATGPAPSLEQARARFEPFAQWSVQWARDLARRDPTFKSIRIFSSTLGDRPREWIQLSEPAANPFGAPNPNPPERTP